MSSSGRAGADREAAVSSIIGAVLALVVSVAGLGLTMLMGAPLMERLNDQAAAESAVGRFDALQDALWRLSVAHESLSVPMDPIGGRVELEKGTRQVVTLGLNAGRTTGGSSPPCSVQLEDWADGDANFTYESSCKSPGKRGANQVEGRGNPHRGGDTECPGGGNGNNGNGNGNGNGGGASCNKGQGGRKGSGGDCGKTSNGACLQAYALPDYGVDRVANVTCFPDITRCRVQLDRPLEGSEWYIQLTSAVDVLPVIDYAETWILDQDRLRWSRAGIGNVEATFEGGAMFSNLGRGERLQSPLPMAESGAGDATYFLRLVTLTAAANGSATISASAELRTALSDGFIRAAYDDLEVDTLRLQFAGGLGTAWCHALVQRNGDDLMPSGFEYAADSDCATGETDGNRSVLYRRLTGAPFDLVFTEVRLDVRLNP